MSYLAAERMQTLSKVNKMAATIKVDLSRFILWLSSGVGIMPSNLSVTSTNSDSNFLIERHLKIGLDFSEILCFLLFVHGIRLSIRQLKRVLFSVGLGRRKNHSDPK